MHMRLNPHRPPPLPPNSQFKRPVTRSKPQGANSVYVYLEIIEFNTGGLIKQHQDYSEVHHLRVVQVFNEGKHG